MKNKVLGAVYVVLAFTLMGAAMDSSSPIGAGHSGLTDDRIITANGTASVQASVLVLEDDGTIRHNGGNARGDTSMDLQLLRDADTNVAGARSSFMFGEANTIVGDASTQYGDGTHSFVVGNYNTVTDSAGASVYGGTFSTVLGADSCTIDGGYNSMILNSYSSGECGIYSDGDLLGLNTMIGAKNSIIGNAGGDQTWGNTIITCDDCDVDTAGNMSWNTVIGGKTIAFGGGASSYNYLFGHSVTATTLNGWVVYNNPNKATAVTVSGSDKFLVANYDEVCLDNALSGGQSDGNCDFLLQSGNTTLGGSLSANTRVLTADADTIADSGDANPATATLTPSSDYVTITCNDVDTCDVTMGESGVGTGRRVCITNISANTVDFADTAGVSELAGDFAMGQYDTLCLLYGPSAWLEISRSNN